MNIDIKTIDGNNELDRLLNKEFVTKIRAGYVEVGEDKFCLPIYYRDYVQSIKTFEVRDDDVFVAAHPKTGTTWAQEMVWLILHNLDYEGAKVSTQKRWPLLEVGAIYDANIVKNGATYAGDPLVYLQQNDSPRCIKTHLHWSLLPDQICSGAKTPKIITILRNPQDTCVSYYHHSRLLSGYKGSFEDFCRLFLAGRMMNGPFWKQVLSYWRERHRKNILFIKYKDMKDDLPSVIKKVAEFLEKPVENEEMGKLCEHLSFESMKANPATNFQDVINIFAKQHQLTTAENVFIRSGKEGGYKSVMTPDLIETFENLTYETFSEAGLYFDS